MQSQVCTVRPRNLKGQRARHRGGLDLAAKIASIALCFFFCLFCRLIFFSSCIRSARVLRIHRSCAYVTSVLAVCCARLSCLLAHLPAGNSGRMLPGYDTLFGRCEAYVLSRSFGHPGAVAERRPSMSSPFCCWRGEGARCSCHAACCCSSLASKGVKSG